MTSMHAKDIVRLFNTEVIEGLNRAVFESLMDPRFINHSAPPGMRSDAESMWNTFHNVLHPALSELRVTILDQIAEGDKVSTRKTISGVHTGPLMGISATGKNVTIDVMDVVRVEDGRYVEHWGVNTLPSVIAHLKET